MLLLFSGCSTVDKNLANTHVTYEVTKEGIKRIDFQSNKEYEGIDLDLTQKDGILERLKVKILKATTMEEAVKATLEVNSRILDALKELTAAARTGALTGS